MKFLFTLQPAYGHFHAMVPLARALAAQGHEVGFATGKGFGPVVQRAGFSHFPCGFDFDGSKDIFEALPQWKPSRGCRCRRVTAALRLHSRTSPCDG